MLIRNLKKEDATEIESIYGLYWFDDFRINLSKRLQEFINDSPVLSAMRFRYFIAEEHHKVVGISAFRKLPEHMEEYALTPRPCELYIIAVKNRGEGIGNALVREMIQEEKSLGYTEMIVYSGETHKESWGFYDHLKFQRVSPAVAPNGEAGQIWRMEL